MITALACSLVGQRQPVRLVPDTRAARLYAADRVIENYYCNYGVNPDYVKAMESAGLRVSGIGDDGEVRIVELPAHPFFVAALFLPQTRPPEAGAHPLLRGYAAAVAAAR